MFAIHAGAAYLPERKSFLGVHAQERNVGYGHLLLNAALFARPPEVGRLSQDQMDHHRPSAPLPLPIAGRAHGLGFLAVAAAKALRDKVGAAEMAKTTHIVVGHASLNQHIAESASGRLQCELSLKNAVPLAIGQMGSLCFYAALPLVDGLLRGPRPGCAARVGRRQVLLVAADKWLFPFFRAFAGLVAYGDGAAALLLRHDDAAPWAKVRGYATEHGVAISEPWMLTRQQLQNALVPLAVTAARCALASAQLPVDRVDEVIAPGWDGAFTDALAAALEIAPARRRRREEPGHLSSADTPIAILQRRRALCAGERRTVLLWDAALSGSAGAMVVELHGAAPSDETMKEQTT